MNRLVPLFLVLLAGCDLVTGGSELDRLRENRVRWESFQIADYDYQFQRSCYCGGDLAPVRVEVRDAHIARVVNLRTGNDVTQDQGSRWPTVDSLFVWSERSIEHGYNLDIVYDASHRFPARVDGDIPRTVDDEFVHTATHFVRR
jgi:hypothetical protein